MELNNASCEDNGGTGNVQEIPGGLDVGLQVLISIAILHAILATVVMLLLRTEFPSENFAVGNSLSLSLKKTRNTIVVNQNICILFQNVLIMVVVWDRDSNILNTSAHRILVIFYTYFMISGLIWMFLKVKLINRSFTNVFNLTLADFNSLLNILLAYGIALVLCFSSAFIGGYICLDSRYSLFSSSLWIYIVAIFILAFANFVLITFGFVKAWDCCQFHLKTENKTDSPHLYSSLQKKLVVDSYILHLFQCISSISILLVLAGFAKATPLYFTFILSNCIQAYFIFWYQCVFNKRVRIKLRRIFNKLTTI